MKYDKRQWSNDVTVNTHCDVTMGRWRCLGNHISQQWVGDVAAPQGGVSVQLYCKALRQLRLQISCKDMDRVEWVSKVWFILEYCTILGAFSKCYTHK